MPIASETRRHAPERHPLIYADILSQAITGELIGMQNYASLVELSRNIDDQLDAVEHSHSEMRHAVALREAAERLNVKVIVDPSAPYWSRVRESFLKYASRGDSSACTIIQEIMLEAFAVSLYLAVADVTSGDLGDLFRKIGKHEESHIDHAVNGLRAELESDRDAFENNLEGLHEEVMTTLSEMIAAEDTISHCGLCKGTCVKRSLHHIGLSTTELRGRALSFYLTTLDRIGVRGEKSLEWVANLPT